MRIIPVGLTVLLIIAARCVGADEFFLGRVLSIDRNRGTVAVEVLDGADDRMKTDRRSARSPSNNYFRNRQSPPAVILVDRNLLPANIAVNSTVRIRGSFDANRGQLSPVNPTNNQMPESPDSPIKHHNDMTGVRHRIEKGSKPDGKQSTPKGGKGSHRKGGHAGDHHER